ncbi:hypothetical protein E4U42_004066 [Claviceps africana]|uniref:Guanine nucleotide exchange factor Vps9 n=1 Tax=Claviceps africana TaxID=83212 RepID=A0A8K0NID0_9HYPO|nr:hypothetical protein E4U42_004066 [Claviceps africana]
MSSPEQPHGREVIDQPAESPAPAHVESVRPGVEEQPAAPTPAPVPAHQCPALVLADTTSTDGGDTVTDSAPQASITPASELGPELQPTRQAQPAGSSEMGEEHAPTHQASSSNSKPIPGPDSADDMASSAATIKPATGQSTPDNDGYARFLSAGHVPYVDPTPATPMTSQPPSRSTSTTARSHRSDDPSPSRSTREDDEDKRGASEDEQDGGSKSEIQSIMEQFSEEGGGPGAEEVMSPRLELTSPLFGGSSQHPPRRSSLEPLSQSIPSQLQDFPALGISASSGARKPSLPTAGAAAVDDQGPPVPPKDGAFGTPPRTRAREDRRRSSILKPPASPQLSLHRPPPPEPEPEPSLPFDFHRFLEQLRNKKADPVARYLKSFLSEFGKKQWMVHEQVKIISDFLAFIANKMMVCEVWRDVSDAEFDNAREGMEKLVMNRLYAQTFSPAIAPPMPIPGARSRRRGADVSSLVGPGRRGQHQEDVERDEILTQKINIYGWIKLDHLDIAAVGESGRRFLKLAQQELLKIKSYRAPRDKIICVLNCSKVIFGLLKHNKSDSSADSFMPLLIYVVLQCNPEHLVSNVQYILRFRNQEKLGGEAGYYLSSLMGAIQFIENMDRSSLTISDDEFERNVEAAVSAIAEKHQAMSPVLPPIPYDEKTASSAGGSSGRPSMDAAEGSSGPRRSTSSCDGEAQDGAAMSGLLRTFQKPLSTIGRIFSDESTSPTFGTASAGGARSPRIPGRRSPQPQHQSPPAQQKQRQQHHPHRQQQEALPRHALPVEEAASRQASAEAAEARRLDRAEHVNVVETLSGMFPDLDRDVISDVVYQKQGRVGLAVDACLALSS